MPSRQPNRRRHPRVSFAPDSEARVVFGYPYPGSHRCVMPLRDLSASGLSFTLNLDLPGLDAGHSIAEAELVVGKKVVRGELLVMRLTPGPYTGAVCGSLFYPREDRDTLKLQEIVGSLASAGV